MSPKKSVLNLPLDESIKVSLRKMAALRNGNMASEVRRILQEATDLFEDQEATSTPDQYALGQVVKIGGKKMVATGYKMGRYQWVSLDQYLGAKPQP